MKLLPSRMDYFLSVSMLGLALTTQGCGPQNQPAAPKIELVEDSEENGLYAVDIPHTGIKWQSIGNCWIYAFFGWAESLIIQHSGETRNFSESYFSYRHFEQQLLAGTNEISTGGSFMYARRLTQRYGLIYEGDFIPEEADRTKSDTQAYAVAYLNESLKNGALKDASQRTPALIRSELDKAFGIRLEDVSSKIFAANEIATSDTTTLADSLLAVREVGLARSGPASKPESSLPEFPQVYSQAEVKMMQRVMRALNDNYPVVINWFVDFNGLTRAGTFDLNAVKTKGSGNQGYHSTVIEDYTAVGTTADGQSFEVGEGLVDESTQALAVSNGQLSSIIIKNSWGGADRPDRFSYPVAGVYGYHKLQANYLFGYMGEFSSDNEREFLGATRGITSFILPAGY